MTASGATVVTSLTESMAQGLPMKMPALPSVNCIIASQAPVAAASWNIQPFA